MEELVFRNSKGSDVTTSLMVSEIFSKRHDNVLQDIGKLGCSKEFIHLNFQEIEYKDQKNRYQKAFEITKDGFSFLVMGYTGAKADKFKEDFISEFNRRGQLNNQSLSLPSHAEALRAWANTLEEKSELQKQLKEAEPAIEFYNQVTDSSDAIDMGTVAKVLNMGIGRNEVFKRLRNMEILMKDNLPYQEFIDKGYFRVIESKYNRTDGSIHVSFKTVVYQKGLDFIRKKSLGYKETIAA